MMGRGVMGTVTAVAPDQFTIKTESGDLYTIHYSVNTRILKGGGGLRRQQQDNDVPFTPPAAIKPTDIKVGDAIGAPAKWTQPQIRRRRRYLPGRPRYRQAHARHAGQLRQDLAHGPCHRHQ